MGMEVDQPRHHEQVAPVDDRASVAEVPADPGDAATLDCDVDVLNPCARLVAHQGVARSTDEEIRPHDQKASVGVYTPQMSRSASLTSPTVARARSASRMG